MLELLRDQWPLLVIGFLAVASLIGGLIRTLVIGLTLWRLFRLLAIPGALVTGASWLL